MESTRPIRALIRGLDALTVLNNLRDGATVSEIAQEIKLPRTTVYRILETLCDAGFVFRDTDDRYRLTIRVRSLSGGFDDDPWVTEIAKPFIIELSRDIVWPVSVASLSGTAMMLRETTDHDTPLATEHYSAGVRLPLLSTAAGLTYLAFCDAAERDGLIELLALSDKDGKAAQNQRPELLRSLADIKTQGFATMTRSRRLVDEVSMSVPVATADRLPAVITVRFISAAVPLKSAVERFLPKLRQCAAKISNSFPNPNLKVGVAATP